MDVDFEPFAYLTAPNAGLYRAVMLAFVGAKRRFIVHLRPEDVHRGTGADTAVADASVSSSSGATCARIRTPAG